MLELDAMFFALAGPAVIFAGISKGGFGSGAAFAGAAILALAVDPGMALAVMLPMLMLVDVATLRPYWRAWSWPEAKVLIAGSIPGVVAGATLYTQADADLIRLLIGAIAVIFVFWQVAVARGVIPARKTPLGLGAGLVAGAVAGFTSFVSHAGGPPAAVYLLSRGLSKTQYQATTVIVFFVVNIAKFIPYAALGMFTQETAMANLALAPFALLGAWLGVKAHRMIPERLFFALAYALLMITGFALLYQGAT